MNKKILAILTAALVLLCVVSCNNSGNTDPKDTLAPFDDESTSTETQDALSTETQGTLSTETQGNISTETETEVPDENAPTFSDVSLKVVVLSPSATVRTSPDKNDATNAVAWPTEGTELTVTGESEQWYRISHGGEDRYIRKSVVGPASALEGYTPISDTVVVNTDSNIRSFPLKDEYTWRTTVKAGTQLERVAVGAEWSIVKITITVEDESGAETQTVKEYYISNSCIDAETVAGTTAETAAETQGKI